MTKMTNMWYENEENEYSQYCVNGLTVNNDTYFPVINGTCSGCCNDPDKEMNSIHCMEINDQVDCGKVRVNGDTTVSVIWLKAEKKHVDDPSNTGDRDLGQAIKNDWNEIIKVLDAMGVNNIQSIVNFDRLIQQLN